MASLVRFRSVALLSAMTVLLVLTASAAAKPTAVLRASGDSHGKPSKDTAVFFAADGTAPGHRGEVRRARPAPDDVDVPEEGDFGDRQWATDRGAAEYRCRLVQPGHGCVAGRPRLHEQHLPHQRPAVCEPHGGVRPERAPGRVDRAVGRARWAQSRPGRMGGRTQRHHSGPDDRLPVVLLRPGRGDELHRPARATSSSTTPRSSPRSGSSSITRADMRARRRSRARPRPRRPGGSGSLPATYSPAMEMRLRVLDFGIDKYGLNAWIFDSTNDGTTNYDKVLFSTTKSAADAVGILAKGEWADVKVKIQGGTISRADGRNARQGRGADRAICLVSGSSTPQSAARIASWPTWPGEAGFTGDFAEYLAQKFPTSTAADFAILEAGVTSEETYVEQGLYWRTGHEPMLEYVVETYDPDVLLAGMPTTDEFQHQFLGLVSPKLPGGAPNPAYDDVDLNGVPDGRVAAREAFVRTAYQEADEVADTRPRVDGQGPDHVRRLRPRLRAAVPGDRRQQAARRHGPPVAAADLELPSRHRRDDRQGQGLLGRRRLADLPERRGPRSGRRRLHRRSPRPTSPPRSRPSRRSTSAWSTRTTGRATVSPRAGG